MTATRLGLILGVIAAVPVSAQTQDAATRQALFAAADLRPPTRESHAAVVHALRASNPAVVVVAIRVLGRFEEPAGIESLLPLLRDARPIVRVEAAHALGQAAQGWAADSTPAAAVGAAQLSAATRRALATEAVPAVRAALARTLGRLPGRPPAELDSARLALTGLLAAPDSESVQGGVRGLDALLRALPVPTPIEPSVAAALRRGVNQSEPGPWTVAARRLALGLLMREPAVDSALVERGLRDPDTQVRRIALSAPMLGPPQIARGLEDPAPMVRYEAVRAVGRLGPAADCRRLIPAARDPDPHVALLAIDLLGTPCPGAAGAALLLSAIVDSLAGTHRGALGTVANWHRGAHALVALARIAPTRVRGLLTRAGADRTWQVRMYAAKAAAAAGDVERLLFLIDDPADNVREAAVTGLRALRGHEPDSLFLALLARPDYQLVLTAATALAGSPAPARAVPKLLAALARITAEQRDTSRDPRLALLARLQEFGTAANATAIEPYLRDFDPAVAEAAARCLAAWTGRPAVAAPRPLVSPAVTMAQVDALRGARLRVTLAASSGGGWFEVAMDPVAAPMTVARVARLAREGHYNGLTFHRVVPNFVIQGGSPGANEYMGDGPFLRDEVGPTSHDRGTLGISTRGRDTGDAQIFVNLVDNPRLDFNYTVWGRVISGMDVVDGVLEGDVIERVELVATSPAAKRR